MPLSLARAFLFAFALAFALSVSIEPARAAARIKDLADVEGVRENMLIGYGLVVGLDGSGDRIRNTPFTRESLVSMLERMGVNIRSEQLDTENIAAVMVTANLPPFARQGARIDVAVSALGDAESLRGGVLLVTPLYGADGEVFAVAQGPLAVTGFAARGQAASLTRGVPTNGRIANGAIVEREIDFGFGTQSALRLALRNPDFTTARRISAAINAALGGAAASVADPGTVTVARPEGFSGDMISLLAQIEGIAVDADTRARVVIDEVSGVVVIGDDVRVSSVAIAQGNLTISVGETPLVSQPAPFSRGGETVVVPRTSVGADDEPGDLRIVEANVRLRDLVDGLNALGVSPRDLISILQAIKAAGALQADIEVM
ncbi:MAG: flagellar basal body P-ring protein FlgI [Parvularculaceae bacterium]|nr:flagellar basal body P-ring protein FlgI [Parvularculaceae bacterium]